jgi:hypothetical protein
VREPIPGGVARLTHRFFPVALTFGVVDLHHSDSDVGLVLAAVSLGAVILTLIGW